MPSPLMLFFFVQLQRLAPRGHFGPADEVEKRDFIHWPSSACRGWQGASAFLLVYNLCHLQYIWQLF
jgi:hypothetical protein